MPAVDLGLQSIADRQQFAVPGARSRRIAASPAQNASGEIPVFGVGFLGDEIEQNGGDLQSVGIDTIHDGIFLSETANGGGFQGTTGKMAPQRALFGALLALKPGS